MLGMLFDVFLFISYFVSSVFPS